MSATAQVLSMWCWCVYAQGGHFSGINRKVSVYVWVGKGQGEVGSAGHSVGVCAVCGAGRR